jgi:hypothetical protein
VQNPQLMRKYITCGEIREYDRRNKILQLAGDYNPQPMNRLFLVFADIFDFSVQDITS